MTDIVERLRGIYRIPITDGLGPVGGGEEPNNPHEFVRKFETPRIQQEAADEIERLRRERDAAVKALEPFAEEAQQYEDSGDFEWDDDHDAGAFTV